MKIYVVGGTKNNFMPLDSIREKFLVDVPHEGKCIDERNPYYCELTGLYHLWQNDKSDIIGLEHYRRYFVNNNKEILNEHEINSILVNHDVILYKYNTNIDKFVYNWNRNKLDEFKKIFIIIKAIYGDEIYNFLTHKFETEKSVCQGNMFIGKRSVLNDYFEFIFSILDYYIKGEEHFGRPLKPRICGYLTEYLFGFYCEYKKMACHYCPIVRYSKDLSTME